MEEHDGDEGVGEGGDGGCAPGECWHILWLSSMFFGGACHMQESLMTISSESEAI